MILYASNLPERGSVAKQSTCEKPGNYSKRLPFHIKVHALNRM